MKQPETGTVQFGRFLIEYAVIRRARRKTVTIAVDPTQGVILYAPEKATAERLNKIVAGKAAWIEKRLRQFDEVAMPPPAREFVSGESFLYLGRHYRLQVARVNKPEEPMVKAWRGRFLVKVDWGLSERARTAAARRLLVEWYKDHARERILKHAEHVMKKLGMAGTNVLIRNPEKRCGLFS